MKKTIPNTSKSPKHSLQQLTTTYSTSNNNNNNNKNKSDHQHAAIVLATTHIPHLSSSAMKALNKQVPNTSTILLSHNNSNTNHKYNNSQQPQHQHHYSSKKKKVFINSSNSSSSGPVQQPIILGGGGGGGGKRSLNQLSSTKSILPCNIISSQQRVSGSATPTGYIEGGRHALKSTTGVVRLKQPSSQPPPPIAHILSPTKISPSTYHFISPTEPPPQQTSHHHHHHRHQYLNSTSNSQSNRSVVPPKPSNTHSSNNNSNNNLKFSSSTPDLHHPEVDDHVDYKLYENLFKNRRKISISCGVHETQGFRQSMEDEHFFVKNMDIFASKPTGLKLHCAFGVFDGHCGKDAATFCKENLCKYIGKSKSFFTNTEKACQEGFLACDEALRKFTEEEELGSPFAGCTANIAIIRDSVITVANCGDSRSVLAHAGKAVAMSEDHKPSRPDEKQRIEALGGVVQFGRVGGLLAVSRAFGDFEYKCGGKNLVCALPDVKSYLMQRNTDFIIVACDGLWDVITSTEAVKFVYEWLLETGDLNQVCEKLVNLAIERCSMDNVTCMLVAFHELTSNNTTTSLGSHKC